MSVRETTAPPIAPKEPVTTTLHGETRVDDYAWLRDKESDRVREYLEAENAYTKAVLAHTEPLQEALYEEMKARIQETDTSALTPVDDWFYYQRTQEGMQYPIFCRRHRSTDGAEEILLDQNLLADGHDYHALGVFSVSPDHRLLAYAEDTTGSESYILRIKDLATGELLPEAIDSVYYGAEWCNDSQTLYYTLHDAAKRPYRLMRHRTGADPASDDLLYEETDEHFFLSIDKTRSKQFLLLTLGSAVTSEVHFADASDGQATFRLVEPRRQEIEYYLEHESDRFLVRTNDEARNYRLMEAPLDDPSRANWREIISHREDVKLEDVDAFSGHLVLSERHEGLVRLRIRDLQTAAEHYVALPEPVYGVWVGANANYDTETLRFVYTSLVTPVSTFDYDMSSRELTLVKEQPVLGGFDRGNYVSERLFATAPDGVRVPISVVYRKGLERNGDNPAWLYGYGSYGASIDPSFSSNRLAALDRGFVYALAHIRGGGDLGEPWHDAGKLLHKRNTFTDFIACAEHLVAERYTRPDRLVIEGASAGGLLMGAVLNMRPDLFGAAIAAVPFVDVLNTILDASLPLTVVEWEEWGNPQDEETYRYMKTYSPYDNVEPKDYPPMLVLGGLNDPRVQYWEPAKWVAKLRATKTDNNRLLLKTHMEAGHGGPSGRYEALRERALVLAFAFDTLGLGDVPT